MRAPRSLRHERRRTAVGPTAELGWIDPLEQTLYEGVQSYLGELLELEVTAAQGLLRYGQVGAKGYRNGHRARELMGAMGQLKLQVPRAQVLAANGCSHAFRSAFLPRYRRLTRGALALSAGAYLAG